MPKQTITTEIDCPEGYEFVRIGKYAGHGEYQTLADGSVRDNLKGQLDRPIFRMLEPPTTVRRELKLVRRTDCDWRQWNGVIDVPMDQSETMIVREVLEGDPTPEVIEEVVAKLEQEKNELQNELRNVVDAAKAMRRWWGKGESTLADVDHGLKVAITNAEKLRGESDE